jgi:hypothetical protein
MPIFVTNPIVSLRKTPINTRQNTCRTYVELLPNINPEIYSLSNNSSPPGVYTVVYINGQNFKPFNTFVNFGPIQKISVVYYSSNLVSFVVPNNLFFGIYSVQVFVNNSNNFNTNTLLYSNMINYTIQNENNLFLIT